MTPSSAVRGFLGFFIILMMMPLGHAFVVLMQRHLDETTLNFAAFALACIGILIAVLGNKLKSEPMKIIAGAFGAILFWGSWVEFMFIRYGVKLEVPPLMEGGSIFTKPEYRLMPVTIPFAFLSLIMYICYVPTTWGCVKVIRRYASITIPEIGKMTKNESTHTFIDLLLLIWWAYLILLVGFDPDILGIRHPITLGFASICLVIGIILFVRSLKARTWASSLRQSIVTVCVLWTFIEVMIKLNFFTEIWIYPERYITEMILILVSFLIAIGLMARFGTYSKRK